MKNSQRTVQRLLPTVIVPFTITPVDFIAYQTTNGCTADGGGSGASNDVASHPANGCAAQNASVALGKPRAGTASQRCDRYRSSQNESTHFNLLDGKPLLEEVCRMSLQGAAGPAGWRRRPRRRRAGCVLRTSTLNEPTVPVTCLVHRTLTCQGGISRIRERRFLSSAAVIPSAMQQAGGVHEMKIRTSHGSMVGPTAKKGL